MALQQYKDPNSATYFGYDPTNQQAIAFSDVNSFNQYFPSFDANAPAPTFDTSKLLATPNQLLPIGATPTTQPIQTAPATTLPTTPVAQTSSPAQPILTATVTDPN